MKFTYSEALQTLGMVYREDVPTETSLQKAFRLKARECHPDKSASDDTSEFLALTDAYTLLLDHVRATRGKKREVEERASERYDKYPCGKAFKSDDFVPRRWAGGVEPTDPNAACVWRCKQCETASSVCCRLKPAKHSCICTHKLSDHVNGECSICACSQFSFHVQQGTWQARCVCKHSHRDHVDLRCTKEVNGQSCECTCYTINWMCTCGHDASHHETVYSARSSKANCPREWVSGLRPECTQVANEKREKWAAKVADIAAITKDPEEAKRQARLLVEKMGLSLVAEARMLEAVDDLSTMCLVSATFRCRVKQGVAYRSAPQLNAKTTRVLRYQECVVGEMYQYWIKDDAGGWLPRTSKGGDVLLELVDVEDNSRVSVESAAGS